MILDLTALIILIICALRGIGKGFVYTFLHTLGWIAGCILAFLFAEPLAGYLSEGALGAMVTDSISGKMEESAMSLERALEGLPEILGGGVFAGIDTVSEFLISLLSSMVISVISFVLIATAAKLLLGLLVRPACRRHGRGIINVGDRILGCTAGLIKGLIIIFMLLAVLMILINIAGADLSDFMVESLDSSLIIKALYDNNLLLLVTGGFFG